MRYFKLILATVALLSTASSAKISTNGRCGPKHGICPDNQCCSYASYCGTTNKHCGNNCQSEFGRCGIVTTTTTTPAKKPTPAVKVSTDGRCGGEFGACPNNLCCSQYGYCGISNEYCGDGCNPEFGKCNDMEEPEPEPATTTTTTTISTKKLYPTSTNSRCGKDFGVCPGNKCCSVHGYCGTTDAYCGKNCQSEFGRCDATSGKTVTTTTTKTKTKTKTKTTTTKNSTATSKISTDGRCGKGFGTRCPDNECCSTYSYCGKSKDHCGTGCQSEFGKCGVEPVPEDDDQYEIPSTSKPASSFQYYYNCVNPKDWALTYDDGPYDYDMELLDLLKEKGIKATFFINGANVMDIKTTKAKEIIQRMDRDGHIVASHTWAHVDISEVSKQELIFQMTELEKYIEKYIGKKPAFMRPPYGAGDGNEAVGKVLKNLGYSAAVMWNVDTLDWDKSGNIDYALSVFKKYIAKGKGILSLNHTYYEDINKDRLIKLAKAEIEYMLAQGYRPVTMDVCLGLKAYQ